MKNSTILLSDIIISDVFKKTTPNNYKMERIRNYIKTYNNIDEPITVSSKNVLLDGYTRYLAAKESGIKILPCIITDENFIPQNLLRCIVGRFNNGAEYVWKTRNNLNISIGDKVLVANKNGRAVVKVVSIFYSNDKNKLKHKPVLKVLN